MKKILIIFLILIGFFNLNSFGQEFSLDELANQTVELTIKEDGEIHVIHQIERSDSLDYVPLINGNRSNFVVTQEGEDEPRYMATGKDMVTITIPPHNERMFIEYDLNDVLYQQNGLWVVDYLYLAKTVFIFPETVDLIYANNRPIKIDEVRGMACHGCDVKIEYEVNKNIQSQQILWENRSFNVEIQTLAKITPIKFDQPKRTLSFDVEGVNQFVTLIIPLELLWNPYQVYLNDRSLSQYEFFNNGTHVWLNFKPDVAGRVSIIGISAIPEFPILIPLFLGLISVLILHKKAKFILR